MHETARLSISSERSSSSRGGGALPRYQSFQRHQSFQFADYSDGLHSPPSSTADLLSAAHLVMVSTTQTKLVGSMLLGFSLVALLENPPSEGGSGAALANVLLGVAVGLSFATTTFAMLESHYLHTLSSAGGGYLARERALLDADYADEASLGAGGARMLGHHHHHHRGGLPDLADRLPVDEEDARLAFKFNGLMADLDRLRGGARIGLWLAMALLTVAVLLRLGGGDLGFVAAGGGLVVALMAAAASPVLRRLRGAYAPLIREYRGLASSGGAESGSALRGGGGAANDVL